VSGRALVNLAVGLVIVGVVGAVLYLEGANDGSGGDASATVAVTDPPTSPATTTTLPPTTLASTTTVAATTTTVRPTTTLAPTTTVAPPPQEFVPVVVANGSTQGERVGITLFRLSELGYSGQRGLNGSVPLPETTVFYQPDWFPAAERLALELGLPATAIAPIETAPPVAGIDGALLMLYLGGP
jgi:hypothetical protein